MTASTLFESHLLAIEQTLDQVIPLKENAPHASLFRAARYSLLAPAKRLRPLLVLITAEIYGAPLQSSLYPACALEMIHTYSLIHDDLPCMDNDDVRRGLPTLHKAYDEGQALLAGDYLLTHAFYVLTESPHLSPEQRLKLIHILSLRAGSEGMIGGQAVDITQEGNTIDWPTLHFMHAHKTAALITAALEFGATIGEAPPSDLLLLSQIGEHLGVAFQIVDDLLDLTGHEQKPTAITLLGMEKGKERADHLLNSALLKISQLSVPSAPLKDLAQKLVNRTF
jgi:geranylgeranyl diphosphate synthase type II